MTNSKKSKQKPLQENRKDGFSCTFCNHVFLSERTLFNHACDKKRKYMQRGERSVTLGLQAYQRFWTKNQKGKLPHWEEFEKSVFYAAFVRFGTYLMDINAENPLGFVDFLLRVEVGIDHWCKESHYQVYIRELNKLETPSQAFERNMRLMEQWAIRNQENWYDFFRKIAPPQAILWIVSGRISPWILMLAPSATDLFNRLNPEQMDIVTNVIDFDFWEVKKKNHHVEVQATISVMIDEKL